YGQQEEGLGALFDLAHAVEIADGRANIFDAHAEQRRHRDAEQVGEFLQRFDLRQLALLEAVERGARNIEPARDLVGAEPRSEAERLESVADIVEADRHGVMPPAALPRSSPRSPPA